MTAKARRAHYINDLALSDYDARQLTATKEVSDFFDQAIKFDTDPKLVSNWLQGEVAQYLNSEKKELHEIGLTPENLTEMIRLISDGTISSKIAKKSLLN